MIKIILRTLVAILTFCFISIGAQADSNSEKAKDVSVKSKFENPDLKLSIEELKKKYPITWLNKKYGDSNHPSCGNSDGAFEYEGPIPDNLKCSFFEGKFYYDSKLHKDQTSYVPLFKINDFSASEIKSVFLREPDNYLKSAPMQEDSRMWELMGITLKYLNDSKSSLTQEEKILKDFVNSDKVLNPTKNSVLCDTINKRFSTPVIPNCLTQKK